MGGGGVLFLLLLVLMSQAVQTASQRRVSEATLHGERFCQLNGLRLRVYHSNVRRNILSRSVCIDPFVQSEQKYHCFFFLVDKQHVQASCLLSLLLCNCKLLIKQSFFVFNQMVGVRMRKRDLKLYEKAE